MFQFALVILISHLFKEYAVLFLLLAKTPQFSTACLSNFLYLPNTKTRVCCVGNALHPFLHRLLILSPIGVFPFSQFSHSNFFDISYVLCQICTRALFAADDLQPKRTHNLNLEVQTVKQWDDQEATRLLFLAIFEVV